MKRRRNPAWKKILWVCGILYSAVFLFCCITPYIPTSSFFLVIYASIVFPYCLAGFIVWLLLTLAFFRRYSWIFFLLLIPAWQNTRVVFSFHPKKTFSYKKSGAQLRILSWNVNNFLYGNITDPHFNEKQAGMIDLIKTSGADILCFQDHSEVASFFGKINIPYIADSLNYPFHYFSNDGCNYGTVIFSRLPILDSGQVKYPGPGYPESVAFITVPFQKETLRIYNTHLHSMYLHSNTLNAANVGYLELVKADTAFLFRTNRFQRLVHFDSLHTEQAKMVKEQLNKTKTPYIFCADLNSVPSGYVYHHIKKGLKDAFLEAGSGLGGTYHRFSLTLRIDVVLLSPQLNATQYFSPQPDLSDHYPIITDIQLQN